MVIERLAHTPAEVLGLLGGHLGLFLGASILSLLHLVSSCFAICLRPLFKSVPPEPAKAWKARNRKDLLRKMCEETSMHGIAQVADPLAPLSLRLFWLVAIILGTAGLAFLLRLTISDFVRGETRLRTRDQPGTSFPSIKMCEPVTLGNWTEPPSGTVRKAWSILRATKDVNLLKLIRWAAEIQPSFAYELGGYSQKVWQDNTTYSIDPLVYVLPKYSDDTVIPLDAEITRLDGKGQNDFGPSEVEGRKLYSDLLAAVDAQNLAEIVFKLLPQWDRPSVLVTEMADKWKLRSFLLPAAQRLCTYLIPREPSTTSNVKLLFAFPPVPLPHDPFHIALPRVHQDTFEMLTIDDRKLAEIRHPLAGLDSIRRLQEQQKYSFAYDFTIRTTQRRMINSEGSPCLDEKPSIPSAADLCTVWNRSCANCVPLSARIWEAGVRGKERICGPWDYQECYKSARRAASADLLKGHCDSAKGQGCPGSRSLEEDTPFFAQWMRGGHQNECHQPTLCQQELVTISSSSRRTVRPRDGVFQKGTFDRPMALEAHGSSLVTNETTLRLYQTENGGRDKKKLESSLIWARDAGSNFAIDKLTSDKFDEAQLSLYTFVSAELRLGPALEQLIQEETPVTDLVTTLGLCGGSLGLVLGASVISFIHFALYLGYCIRRSKKVAHVTNDDSSGGEEARDSGLMEFTGATTMHGIDLITADSKAAWNVCWTVLFLTALAALTALTMATIQGYRSETTETLDSFVDRRQIFLQPIKICYPFTFSHTSFTQNRTKDSLREGWDQLLSAYPEMEGGATHWALGNFEMSFLVDKEMETQTIEALSSFLNRHNLSNIVELAYRLSDSSLRPLVFAEDELTDISTFFQAHRQQICSFIKTKMRELEVVLAFPPAFWTVPSFTVESSGGVRLATIRRPTRPQILPNALAHNLFDGLLVKAPDWKSTTRHSINLAVQ